MSTSTHLFEPDSGSTIEGSPTVTKPNGQLNVHSQERWASVIAGGLLALYGLSRRSRGGMGLALLGGSLIARGATGHCDLYQAFGVNTAHSRRGLNAALSTGEGVRVEESITIDRPAGELYTMWRDLKNLPNLMTHVESIDILDTYRSRWQVRGPMGKPVSWYADIINDERDSLIAWRSIPGSEVMTAGSVHFKPMGNGTEVKVVLRYDPPAGKLGSAIAWLLGEEPAQQVRADLQRFKQVMETGI
jgi:uncharacterized membrane protein